MGGLKQVTLFAKRRGTSFESNEFLLAIDPGEFTGWAVLGLLKKLYPLADLPKEPDARRQLLLRVKAKAKKAGFPVKVWLDASGLHVEGSVAMFRAIERET